MEIEHAGQARKTYQLPNLKWDPRLLFLMSGSGSRTGWNKDFFSFFNWKNNFSQTLRYQVKIGVLNVKTLIFFFFFSSFSKEIICIENMRRLVSEEKRSYISDYVYFFFNNFFFWHKQVLKECMQLGHNIWPLINK